MICIFRQFRYWFNKIWNRKLQERFIGPIKRSINSQNFRQILSKILVLFGKSQPDLYFIKWLLLEMKISFTGFLVYVALLVCLNLMFRKNEFLLIKVKVTSYTQQSMKHVFFSYCILSSTEWKILFKHLLIKGLKTQF